MEQVWETAAASARWPTAALASSAACWPTASVDVEFAAAPAIPSADSATETAGEAAQLVCEIR